jgi:hypothetical protein
MHSTRPSVDGHSFAYSCSHSSFFTNSQQSTDETPLTGELDYNCEYDDDGVHGREHHFLCVALRMIRLNALPPHSVYQQRRAMLKLRFDHSALRAASGSGTMRNANIGTQESSVFRFCRIHVQMVLSYFLPTTFSSIFVTSVFTFRIE